MESRIIDKMDQMMMLVSGCDAKIETYNASLEKYSIVFSIPQSLPPTRSVDHAIPLHLNAKPFKLKPYRYPHSQKTEIEKQVQEMLTSGIIKPSNSIYASPVILVKKKDNT